MIGPHCWKSHVAAHLQFITLGPLDMPIESSQVRGISPDGRILKK